MSEKRRDMTNSEVASRMLASSMALAKGVGVSKEDMKDALVCALIDHIGDANPKEMRATANSIMEYATKLLMATEVNKIKWDHDSVRTD